MNLIQEITSVEKQVMGSIRALQGLLERLKKEAGIKSFDPRVQIILETVAAHVGLPHHLILSRLRVTEVMRARTLAVSVAKEITGYPLQQLADAFLLKAHGSVAECLQRSRDWLTTQPRYAADYKLCVHAAQQRIAEAKISTEAIL